MTDFFINLDWSALDFIFAAIHYSGKVNDSWDKRCVATLLRNIVNSKIIKCANVNDENSLLAHNFIEGDERYTCSFVNAHTTIQDIINYGQNLPSIDSTKVFGMSTNSDIVNQ